jgi:hypothetical protein
MPPARASRRPSSGSQTPAADERNPGFAGASAGNPVEVSRGDPFGDPETPFAHPVERELARLFDAFHVRWLYEPHTFVLRRNRRGRVTEAFTPDFYLPDLDYYLECTVARRGLTRVKRRKAEAAQRLYGVVVEILYRGDFETLARRWSLRRLADELERTR